MTLIADRIAKEWYNMAGDEHAPMLYSITRHALKHDRYEAVSGDFPGIIKDLVDEKALEDRYADQFEPYYAGPIAKEIVKIADRVEAVMFLRLEQALGNTTVEFVLQDVMESLHKYLVSINRTDLWERFVNEVLYGGWSATGMKCHPLNRSAK